MNNCDWKRFTVETKSWWSFVVVETKTMAFCGFKNFQFQRQRMSRIKFLLFQYLRSSSLPRSLNNKIRRKDHEDICVPFVELSLGVNSPPIRVSPVVVGRSNSDMADRFINRTERKTPPFMQSS